MEPTKTADYWGVLEKVHAWPAELRLALAEALLYSLHRELHPNGARGVPVESARLQSLKDLLGLIETDGPPPNDEACRGLLEAELLRKYSGG